MVLIWTTEIRANEMTMLGSSKNNENPPTVKFKFLISERRRGYKSRFCSGKYESGQ